MWRPWEETDGTSTNSTNYDGTQGNQVRPGKYCSFCKDLFKTDQCKVHVFKSLSFASLLNSIGSTKRGRVRANASEREEQLVSEIIGVLLSE